METGTAIVLVGGLGVAGYLYFRSQQNQQAAVVAAAAAAAAAPAMGPGGQPAGGGVGGLLQRGIAQWRQDPLGIQNTKAAIGAGVGVAKSAAGSVVHAATDVVGFVKGIF